MNFNSLQYYLFLPLSLILYYSVRPRWKNSILLLLSFGFYMCWEPRYALLMLTSIIITYICGLLTEKQAWGKRKLWVGLSLFLNLSILFFYKYFNFSATLITELLETAGFAFSAPSLDVLLPVGISFYTFQALGYTMDVYRGDMSAERSFIDYALFVSFFPQLVAGPIERSGNLLPQIKEIHKFSYQNLHEGAVYVLWGIFKKLVIADWAAVLVDTAYAAPVAEISGLQYVIATGAFAIQIYCDFSAYSDIAIGSARMLGIRLMKNFDAPYLAVSIRDFWRRWHISLSSWFKDYLYFPLGGSRRSKARTGLNLMIVFGISGLWHGAGLTFVVWGLINGLYQVLGIILRPRITRTRAALGLREDGRLLTFFRWLFTMCLVCFSWIFFRAENISQALAIIKKISAVPFSGAAHTGIALLGLSVPYLIVLSASVLLLFVVDRLQSNRDLAASIANTVALRYVIYFCLISACLIFGYYGSGYDPQAFIYFQF